MTHLSIFLLGWDGASLPHADAVAAWVERTDRRKKKRRVERGGKWWKEWKGGERECEY